MPGTQQTLFDAFRLTESQGLGGSPLERALTAFNQNDPRPSPLPFGSNPAGNITGMGQTLAPPQETIGQPQTNTPGIFRTAGDLFERAAPVFQGSSFLDFVLPGDPGTAIKSAISDVPVVGDFTAEVLDNVLSPATLLVAARGVQMAGALSKLPVAGKFAGALVDPILRTGSFGARFGVEASAIIGGTALGQMTESAPFPVQVAA